MQTDVHKFLCIAIRTAAIMRNNNKVGNNTTIQSSNTRVPIHYYYQVEILLDSLIALTTCTLGVQYTCSAQRVTLRTANASLWHLSSFVLQALNSVGAVVLWHFFFFFLFYKHVQLQREIVLLNLNERKGLIVTTCFVCNIKVGLKLVANNWKPKT